MNKKVLSYLAAVLTMTIWGLSFIFSKIAFGYTDPVTLLAYRFIIAFILLHLTKVLFRIRFDMKGKPVRHLLVMGVIQPILYYLCENYGVLYSSATFSGVMVALIPIAALFGAAVFLKERPGFFQVLFSVISVAGVIILSVSPGGGSIATVSGALLMSGAVAAAAAFMILTKKIAPYFTAFERTYFMFAESSAFFVPLAFVRARMDVRYLLAPLAERNFVIAAVFLGVLASYVCYFCQNYYISYLSIAEAAVMANLATVVTIIAGILILGEPFSAKTVPCTLMIVGGVIGVQLTGISADPDRRHRRWDRVLKWLLTGYFVRKFNFTFEEIRAEEPFILISNHESAYDPIFVDMGLDKKTAYYVASEHIFRKGFLSVLLKEILQPIPRRKAAGAVDTVKSCVKHLKAGHNVVLFAEGEQSWDGRSIPIYPSTGKLVRLSGVSLVTYRLEGAYLSAPRWARYLRRGRVHGHPVGVYSAETLRAMKPEAIDHMIERDISENVWERQKADPVRYTGKKLAEGMETALYACPGCRKIGTLRTKENEIFCSCGFSASWTETGFFRPETPFENIAAWDDWQKELLRSGTFIRAGAADAEPAGTASKKDDIWFSDPGITLTRLHPDHTEERLGTGVLTQYRDRLVWETRVFPMDEISDMAQVRAHILLMSFRGEYFEFRSDQGANFRKYIEMKKDA